MKLSKFSLRGVLATVLSVAIVASTFVFAVPVAADQAWPLQLVGASTVNMTQAQFEALAAAYPSNTYTDGSGHQWKGVAMWRLIALVDDTDPNTFNSALAAANVYTINMVAADGYSKAITPPYTGFAFQSPTEDLFVANKVMLSGTTEWVDLPPTKPGDPTKLCYPLMDTGSGITVNNMRVAALTKIELQNLPVASASVSTAPASQMVANGANFDVAINVNVANAMSRGGQMQLTFDASKLILNSISEGTFYSTYATANGGSTLPFPVGVINNVAGTVSDFGYSITGAGTGGPTGSGLFATLHFTAKNPVDAYAAFTPTAVVISNELGAAIPLGAVTGGNAGIGTLPAPDLVVFASQEDWVVSGTSYTITYTIKNIGNADAGASTTSIVIDSGTPITITCPALIAGASDTKTVSGTQTISGASDTIVIIADSAAAVAESNENNNTKTDTVYAVAPSAGDTIVNGNILSKIVLTCPQDVQGWALIQGDNTIARTLNVKANNNYQVTAWDQNAQTNGRMREWNPIGGGYGVAQLINNMHVRALSDVTLAGPGTILTGTPAGQAGDGGQTFDVNFDQHVEYADPVIINGNVYHIVVTFTGSIVF